ncbi:hypothetical protein DL98DRAFT_190909 [Cadophora sp. DSE1049]|nr:hypothetical protein DL98DRAFT_190909 [Cadophora sp. DSE1049]
MCSDVIASTFILTTSHRCTSDTTHFNPLHPLTSVSPWGFRVLQSGAWRCLADGDDVVWITTGVTTGVETKAKERQASPSRPGDRGTRGK